MFTVNQFLNHEKEIADYARNHWNYGDSHSLPPCADDFISCDRHPARTLYDLGWTDQQRGGFTVLNAESYLTKKGCTIIRDKTKTKRGDIVLMRKKGELLPSAAWHMFTMDSDYNGGIISKFDEGSNDRIHAGGHFVNVPFDEWVNREFYCAFRLPVVKRQYSLTVDAWKAGDKNSSVKIAQMILSGRGYKGKDGKALKRDGSAGTNTVYALKKFQEKHGLIPNGICNKKTWSKLFAKGVKLI